MNRLFSALCSFALLAAVAAGANAASPAPKATPCHGANGKFVKCASPTPAPAMAKKPCRGANGKFVKCGASPAPSSAAMKASPSPAATK